jgi:DNA polymerase delta subunit 3
LSDAQGSLLESNVTLSEEIDGPKTYGTIANANAKKRTREGRPAVSATPAPVQNPATMSSAKTQPKDSSAKTVSSTTAQAKKAEAPASSTPGGSGSIFQSFAKASTRKTANPKSKPESATALSPTQDTPIFAVSDDEEDDGFSAKPVVPEKGGEQKSRMQRHEDLRRMMEEDDNGTENKGPTTDGDENDSSPGADSPLADSEETNQQTSQNISQEPAEAPEALSMTLNGRRRGRRRVTKKKSVMDDEGYFGKSVCVGWEPTKLTWRARVSHGTGGGVGVLLRGRSTTCAEA